ncbi:hypothetical protein [Litoribacter populi]|uniref:hypothetical protein n=1 Tax=Litoribacter populi TaxID=2598460 RepID=UPI00117F7E78|nr:hypothetical protein [Litoribacter populi]
MNAKRQPLTLIAFLIFAMSSWAQTAKPIDPLKFLTNFEAVPTEDGEATTFSQDLPPCLVYRIKHLGFNEVLLYNEALLYQGEPQNLQYFMGKLKIQGPTLIFQTKTNSSFLKESATCLA